MAQTEDVPWLDDDEQQAWLSLASLLVRLPAALDAQLRRDAGLSHFEYMVLAALSMSDDRTMRMSDLAVIAEGSLSRLSHTCKRLESQQWITRHPDPEDGRITRAFLTEAGYAKVAETAPGHVRTVRRLVLEPLTKAQVDQLATIINRINDAIEPRWP
ncbi:MAG TPA: MarR family transcriptional regulator [Aquihabitans sp.]|jgi:DNA-binding MarR family transcriptional regulator|nr:MarR family transcriptional regulator [Aquihabitans sp.]